MIQLDNIKMNVINTAVNGVVNEETIFCFKQSGTLVTAEYSGGETIKGSLVGANDGSTLNFSYCQLQPNGKIDNGFSKCHLSTTEQGLIKMVEHFKWGSRNEEQGVNIFEELRS